MFGVLVAAGCAFVIARAVKAQPSRTRRAYRLWAIPFFTGIGMISCWVGYDNVRPLSWPALTYFDSAAVASFWLGVLILAVHILVGSIGWPKMLVPQAFRDSPTWVDEARLAREDKRERKRAGLPPTDHLVEIREVNLDEGDRQREEVLRGSVRGMSMDGASRKHRSRGRAAFGGGQAHHQCPPGSRRRALLADPEA